MKSSKTPSELIRQIEIETKEVLNTFMKYFNFMKTLSLLDTLLTGKRTKEWNWAKATEGFITEKYTVTDKLSKLYQEAAAMVSKATANSQGTSNVQQISIAIETSFKTITHEIDKLKRERQNERCILFEKGRNLVTMELDIAAEIEKPIKASNEVFQIALKAFRALEPVYDTIPSESQVAREAEEFVLESHKKQNTFFGKKLIGDGSLSDRLLPNDNKPGRQH